MSDNKQKITVIAKDILTVSASNAVSFDGQDIERTFQATVVGTGAISATVLIEVSNDGIGWLSDTASTLTLSGAAGLATAGFSSNAPWGYVRANITAISGTGAAVTVTAGS